MASRNNWPGKLLVDLTTGNIAVERFGEGGCTSDVFVPNSYNSTVDYEYQDDDFLKLLEYQSVTDSYHDGVTPNQSSTQIALAYNIDGSRSRQYEISNILNPEPLTLNLGMVTPRFNAPQLKKSGQRLQQFRTVASGGLIENENNQLILDEVTGFFVFKDVSNAARYKTENFILDEKTGVLIELDQDENNLSQCKFGIHNCYEKQAHGTFKKNQKGNGNPYMYMGRKMEKNLVKDQFQHNFLQKK